MAKVKVTKAPKPLYQQNKQTFALDTYPSMPMDKSEQDYSSQYPIADRDEANIEAEKGENILTPDLENYRIGGKKHSQGGTPLDADEGSFIYSNDRKLRIKGEALREFGINPESDTAKKGLTPAELAKKYPTNKFLDLIRSKDSDKLDKETAALTLIGMKKKLGRIAFLQEAMKGFPSGMPEIADRGEDEGQPMEDSMMNKMMKRGGIVKFQAGGTNLREDIPGPNLGSRYSDRMPHPHPNERMEDFKKRVHYDETLGKWVNEDFQENPYRNKIDNGGTDRRPVRQPGESVEHYKDRTFYDDTTQKWFNVKTLDPVVVQANARKKKPALNNFDFTGGKGKGVPALNPNDAGKIYPDDQYDTGYGNIDYVNMAAPFAIGINKYNPVRLHINPQQVAFNPLDFEAQRQAIKGQTTTAMLANNTFAGSAGMASSRNAQLLGQSLDPINQSFMTEFNANQAGRTQADAQNAQFRQQADTFNAQMDDTYNSRQALVNENYDNERRLRLKAFLQGWNNAEKNRQIRNAGNVINQDYMMTANGNILRKPSSMDPARQFARITGSNSGGSGVPTWEEYKASLPADVSSSAKPEDLWRMYQTSIYATYQGKSANGTTVSSRNPYLIPQAFDYEPPAQ